MKHDLATAMRRALQKTSASDPAGATAIIQAALAGEGQTDAGAMPPFRMPTARAGLDWPSVDLGQTSFRFPAGAGRAAAVGQPADTELPDGSRIETRSIVAATGSRDYRLFVPPQGEEGYAGLLIMLHGCTQTPEDFARGTGMDKAAAEAGFVVAYPQQTGGDNAQSCWNWFRPGDQTAGKGEPGLLAELARELAAEFDLHGRVFAAGLSAGGAMAAILAEAHPEVFAAVGIHSGLPVGAAQDLPSAFAAMDGTQSGRPLSVPGIVFHGSGDRTVSSRNAHMLVPGSGVETRHSGNGRCWTRLTTEDGSELWLVEDAGHAWFGGSLEGSYADPSGPDASSEMLRFFQAVTARQNG